MVFFTRRSSSEQEFEIVFKRNYRALCLLASLLLKSPEDAQDVVNDVFEYTWKNYGQLKKETLDAYLHTLGASRRVAFSGEGFFEVKRDTIHPFCIETDEVRAQVLGTSFNLRHYAREQFQLTLLTGRVALESAQKDFSKVMKPGEEAELQSNGTLLVKTVQTAQSALWREGYFAYDDIPMSEMLCDLGRWYNINVKVLNDRAMSRRIHFKCKRSLPVDDVLELLNELGHFRLVRKGDTIFLR